MENKREKLSSRLGFIFLSAGCAIGLGNIWRFPYMVGKYGGGAFVLVYLFFLFFWGFPLSLWNIPWEEEAEKAWQEAFMF